MKGSRCVKVEKLKAMLKICDEMGIENFDKVYLSSSKEIVLVHTSKKGKLVATIGKDLTIQKSIIETEVL